MEELYIEGVATHSGPESCVVVCKGAAKRRQGHVQAGLSSHKMWQFGVPTLSGMPEGNTRSGDIARRRRQRTTACTEPPCARTGRSRAHPSV